MSDSFYEALMRAYGAMPSEEQLDRYSSAAAFIGPSAPAAALRGVYQGLLQEKIKDEALRRLLERGGEVPFISGETSLRANREDRPDLANMKVAAKFLLARILPKFLFKGVGGVPMFFPGGQ